MEKSLIPGTAYWWFVVRFLKSGKQGVVNNMPLLGFLGDKSKIMEWLNTHIEYWHWFVLGAVLIITEVFVPGFVFLWFGISAIVIAILSKYVVMSFTMQLLLWAVLSVVAFFALKKLVAKNEHQKLSTPAAREALISQVGLVISANTGKPQGTLRFPSPVFGTDQWAFECDDELDVGEKVIVNDICENALMVNKYK